MHHKTVFVVDDDPSIRDAVSLLVSLHGHPTATFGSAEDFLGALRPDWRGCVVIDIRMPGMSGLDLQNQLLDRAPGLPAILITAHGDVAAARQAFRSQAVDFLEKPFDAQDLLKAIERALKSTQPAAPPDVGQSQHASTLAQRLSPREREVMQWMVKGLHNRRIAEALGISPRTVEVHRARVLQKMQVDNVVELVRRLEGQRSD